jgi:hypothetical protein
MRDILNLQALKHSKNKKHRTIYEKAHRIMAQGWETKELSEEEIMQIASKYPTLKVTVLVGGDILVQSKKDTWLIRDEVRFYTLYHKGMVFEKGRIKEKYHVQDVFYDIEFIFASIVSHDDYALGIQARTTQDLIDMVRQNNQRQAMCN